MQTRTDDSPLDLERLLHDAIGVALAREEPDHFLAWFREHLADYRTDASDGAWLDGRYTTMLGRSIWNALPLPGNGFKPRPLPEPGRNDLCFCGSGSKYKRCCAGATTLPLDPEAILPTVLDRTPPESLTRLIRAGRVPVRPIVELAARRVDRGELWNAVALLEPLLDGGIRHPDADGATALDLLCDLYTQLGRDGTRAELLERVSGAATPSPLRSGAWQRVAVERLDRGDTSAAWEAFHHARRDHPDAPGVGLMEMQLLMATGREQEAPERAADWEQRLRRLGYGDDDRSVGFFAEMARDPHGVMRDMGLKAAGGAGGRLVKSLQDVVARPLPDYRAVEPDAGSHDAPCKPPGGLRLSPPPAIAELEHAWRGVFPLGKPAAIHDAPSGHWDPWEAGVEQTWMGFLDSHPQGFDSLDVLDDLAAAAGRHAQFGAGWLDRSILEPLLARAEAIVEQALDGRPAPRLPWTLDDNRPGLRSLARRARLHARRGEDADAAAVAERMLALNPDDDHDFKARVMNHRLRTGDDAGALSLATQYPDDTGPECAYGRVLAHYRLGDHHAARAALRRAMEMLPAVARHLTGDPPQPTPGDADNDARRYRAAMRDVWLATPGAVEWLERTAEGR